MAEMKKKAAFVPIPVIFHVKRIRQEVESFVQTRPFFSQQFCKLSPGGTRVACVFESRGEKKY